MLNISEQLARAMAVQLNKQLSELFFTGSRKTDRAATAPTSSAASAYSSLLNLPPAPPKRLYVEMDWPLHVYREMFHVSRTHVVLGPPLDRLAYDLRQAILDLGWPVLKLSDTDLDHRWQLLEELGWHKADMFANLAHPPQLPQQFTPLIIMPSR